MTTAAILLAGGSGARMRRADNKVFADVGGHPLLVWSVETFVGSPAVDHVVLVVRAGDHERVRAVLDDAELGGGVRLATGGATRQASEQAGLDALGDLDGSEAIEVVLIHDTARPFASAALIDRIARAAHQIGGAVPTLPLGADVYRVTAAGALEPQPDDLFRVQTPQGFRTQPLREAYRHAARDSFVGVDTVENVQRYGRLAIASVPGEPDNIKITFADDLTAAHLIAGRRR